MNRFIASIAGIAVMAVAGVAAADCISTCENNCTFLGDPGSIGLCIANCPQTCQPVPIPACELNTNPNRCTVNSPIVVTADSTGFRISNDGGAGSPTAFMHLVCTNGSQFRNAFQGSRTVQRGAASVRISCPSGLFPANIKCGINSTCNN